MRRRHYAAGTEARRWPSRSMLSEWTPPATATPLTLHMPIGRLATCIGHTQIWLDTCTKSGSGTRVQVRPDTHSSLRTATLRRNPLSTQWLLESISDAEETTEEE